VPVGLGTNFASTVTFIPRMLPSQPETRVPVR
jgi:hypothetical protein